MKPKLILLLLTLFAVGACQTITIDQTEFARKFPPSQWKSGRYLAAKADICEDNCGAKFAAVGMQSRSVSPATMRMDPIGMSVEEYFRENPYRQRSLQSFTKREFRGRHGPEFKLNSSMSMTAEAITFRFWGYDPAQKNHIATAFVFDENMMYIYFAVSSSNSKHAQSLLRRIKSVGLKK